MASPIRKLLAKMGLKESEQALVVRGVTISTVICVLLIAGFWAFDYFGIGREKDDESGYNPLTPDAHLAVREIVDLDIEAHEFAAQRYMQAGRAEMAIPHLHRIAGVRRGERAASDALERMVRAYLEIGDFDKALAAADRLILTPGVTISTSLMVCRAIAFYNMREYGESTRILTEVLAREPNNAEALSFMAQMEAAAQPRSPAAEQLFRRAIEADSNYTEAKYQFARYFENNGDYRNARNFLQQVLAKDPLNVRAHARLGMIHYYELNADAALRSYQTALALNPFDYNTRYNLGELYRTLLNDNENALREFVAALNLNPRHSEANFRAGLVCAENGMMKEAVRYFEASLRENRRDPRRLLQLAAAYERVGDRNTALSIYREITDIDPLHGIALQKIRFLEAPE
jgi:tetratricopeptide (TPR) repeat protein